MRSTRPPRREQHRGPRVRGFCATFPAIPEDDWLRRRDFGDPGRRISPVSSKAVPVDRASRVSAILKTLGQQPGEHGRRACCSRQAAKLRARWVLVSGAFQRSGDAVRVTASVTEVAKKWQPGRAHAPGSTAVSHAVFELQDQPRAGACRHAAGSRSRRRRQRGRRPTSSRPTRRSRAGSSIGAPRRSSRLIGPCCCSSRAV